MHAAAEGREDAEAPVADLVAEALDHDRLIRRQHTRGLALLAQEGDQVARRLLVEVRRGSQLFRLAVHRPTRELAYGAAKLDRTANLVALPERHRARQSRRRSDDHAVTRDLLDAPGRRAEQEGLARARLVDHLLVELAHAASVWKR